MTYSRTLLFRGRGENCLNITEAIDTLGKKNSFLKARATAVSLGIDWNNGIDVVFIACVCDPQRRPKVGGKHDTAEEAIAKWVGKYKAGYDNRPSTTIGKPPQTVSDSIIDEMISVRLPKLSAPKIKDIKYAHRLSMSAENILGLFLEEYLAFKLKPHDWHCAWGQTLKSVDFCHRDGALLQVKNRSNTENSSSSKIREGTDIKKWYRVDALKGNYLWDDIQKITDASGLSEENFRRFVITAIRKNPDVLPVEEKSPWKE